MIWPTESSIISKKNARDSPDNDKMTRKAFKIKPWIEAMRLRTLPVSVAGVIAAAGCACYYNSFNAAPFFICLLFAVLAQIISNFANEYFDYKNGLDHPGRVGFRRGVTEGDIAPRAMRNATLALIVVDAIVGASLIFWGGWWLMIPGIAIAVFALAYSAGPWPLSHHGLGEIAVVIFFGIIPVTLTAYVQSGDWTALPVSLPVSFAIGFMGANVLLVNNYRDYDDDRKVGKHTLAVIFGRQAAASLYLVNGFIALLFFEIATISRLPMLWQIGPLIYINIHWILWSQMRQAKGAQLNPLLGKTSILMPAMALWLLLALYVCHI